MRRRSGSPKPRRAVGEAGRGANRSRAPRGNHGPPETNPRVGRGGRDCRGGRGGRGDMEEEEEDNDGDDDDADGNGEDVGDGEGDNGCSDVDDVDYGVKRLWCLYQ